MTDTGHRAGIQRETSLRSRSLCFRCTILLAALAVAVSAANARAEQTQPSTDDSKSGQLSRSDKIALVQLLQPSVEPNERERESESEDLPRPPSPLLPESTQPTEDDRRGRASPFASAFANAQRQRLQTPWMFGPSFLAGRLISLERTSTGPDDVQANLPFVGDNGHARMSVNNKAYTDNRVFFIYQHFHSALGVDRFPPGAPAPAVVNSFDVDRYLFGWEKSTRDGCWSVELRLPLFSGMDVFSAPPGGGPADFTADSGTLGNLAVILKRMLYEDCCTSIVGGMGITLPTGDDVRGQLPALSQSFIVSNDAVHLMPYVGFLRTPNERFFYQGFLQLDIAANGDRIEVFDLATPALASGLLNAQTLMFLDVSAGWWLYSNPCSSRVTGLASLIELHYTTTLQNTDFVVAAPTPPAFSNVANRIDSVDLTLGLHIELGTCSSLRVGGVVPLRSGNNRFFDSEIQVQLNRRF